MFTDDQSVIVASKYGWVTVFTHAVVADASKTGFRIGRTRFDTLGQQRGKAKTHRVFAANAEYMTGKTAQEMADECVATISEETRNAAVRTL